MSPEPIAALAAANIAYGERLNYKGPTFELLRIEGGTDIVGRLTRDLDVPVGFNTDVTSSALAESRWGLARGISDFAYITVGTGVGVGLIVAGKPVFGCNHTELDHVRIARAAADAWPGVCRFHGDCVEGLACGPAIVAHAGVTAEQIADDSPAWELAPTRSRSCCNHSASHGAAVHTCRRWRRPGPSTNTQAGASDQSTSE